MQKAIAIGQSMCVSVCLSISGQNKENACVLLQGEYMNRKSILLS